MNGNLKNVFHNTFVFLFTKLLYFSYPRFKLLSTSTKRMNKDGLNSLKYDILSIANSSILYTHILVTYNETELRSKYAQFAAVFSFANLFCLIVRFGPTISLLHSI